jgi:hypothetical protein
VVINFLTSSPRCNNSFGFLPFIDMMPRKEAESFETLYDKYLFCDLSGVPSRSADIYVATLRRVSCVLLAWREEPTKWQNSQIWGIVMTRRHWL